MIKSHLHELMAAKKIRSISSLAKEIELDRRTLTAMYDDKSKGVDYDTLIKLCRFFKCNVGDLLEFVDEGKS